MRDYGKVHTSFWTSSNIRALTEDGRTLALYLLTCPHGTIAGVFRLPDGYACEDLQWPAKKVQTTLTELFANGFATRCEATKWVWVMKHFEWNPPENPNQKKCAAKMASQVPDLCSWKAAFIGKCVEVLGIEAPKQEIPKEPLPNPSGTLPQPVTVTVTVTEDKNSGSEDGQPASPAAPLPPEKTTKGTRLPVDWLPDERLEEWARQERPDLDLDSTVSTFQDFWKSKPGKDGTKLDWNATFRNWVRSTKTPVRATRPTSLMAGVI